MKNLFLFIFTLALLSSCGKDELSVAEQFDLDTKLIEEYLKVNNKTALKTSEGIYYIVEKEGTAEKPKLTSSVTVSYKGYFLDNVVFDSSNRAVFPFILWYRGGR